MDSSEALTRALDLVALQAGHQALTAEQMGEMIRVVHAQILALSETPPAPSAAASDAPPTRDDRDLGLFDVLDADEDRRKAIQVLNRARKALPDLPSDTKLRDLPAATVSADGASLRCLECGGDFVLLSTHLQRIHNMTSDEYRERWLLPADYAVIPPAYLANRRQRAAMQGLGTKVQRKTPRTRKVAPPTS